MSRTRISQARSGFTLVELMIAMVVGLLLTGGVIQIFSGSSESYRMQEGFSRLQDNGRFAMDVLTINLRHAGFKTNALGTDAFEFPVDATVYAPSNVSFPTAAQVVAGTENNQVTDNILNGSDTVGFRFQGTGGGVSAPLSDCSGVTPGANAVAINILYVNATANTLNCMDSAGQDQSLLDGVQGMQVLYGVDTDGDRIANRYSNAADATTNGDWARIVGVRIALLLNTVQGITNAPDTTQYTLLNDAAVGPFNDQLRRHVFTTTIALRNLLP